MGKIGIHSYKQEKWVSHRPSNMWVVNVVDISIYIDVHLWKSNLDLPSGICIRLRVFKMSSHQEMIVSFVFFRPPR